MQRAVISELHAGGRHLFRLWFVLAVVIVGVESAAPSVEREQLGLQLARYLFSFRSFQATQPTSYGGKS